MALRDTWHRALVYFGLAEDYGDEHGPYEPETGTEGELLEAERAPRTASVRRLDRSRRRDEIDDIFADEPAVASPRTGVLRPVEGNGGAEVQVHLVTPRTFNDAQEVADNFKRQIPVIMNLQSTDDTIARRLVDFASGLVYGLDGKIELVANRVYLLTPANVEVSAEERERIAGGAFYNQF